MMRNCLAKYDGYKWEPTWSLEKSFWYNRSSFYGQLFMYSCWGLGQKQLTKHSFGCHGFHFGSKGYFSFFFPLLNIIA